MPSHKLIQIVAAESTPEKDAAFEKWYTGKHIPTFLKFAGLKQVNRYKLKGDISQNCSKYLTIYEFDTEADLAAFPKSPAFAEAVEDFEKMKDKIAFTGKWAAVYELIKTWEK
ncbi:MAG: DUF4286 family protein [Dehalococcoidales bacterium]